MVMLNVIRTTRLVTPVMQSRKAGAIGNISSAFAFEPKADFPVSILRAAWRAWTKFYGDTQVADGLRMNYILNGFTDSVPARAEQLGRIPMRRHARLD